ncbi:hypothetical protein MSMTP_2288 [Methanosarcina sp. MTP4]|uniref:hypothetical protein n=1 Tax=Methanosarcina sp. MTP4 TaxID=1434100 RepID=UPI000615DD2F|nr:hypothetical protein [Methanosarcina sp. MTP4]AKB25757.1 hypothetical protein MSMTP_2288 [Methanosarcina sp. MTP4]
MKIKYIYSFLVILCILTSFLFISGCTDEESNEEPDEVTIKFPEEKKEELVEILKTHYEVKDARVIFVPKTKSLMVDYYVDNIPAETDLYDDIVGIIIISKSIATESGITNPNVVVGALSLDETLLGQGYYYSSTDETNVDIFLQT